MSNQIDTARVQQYHANVLMLAQQKGSKLQGTVRREVQKSKADFWDRIGAVAAQKKTSRHGDTPLMNTPHSRRKVTMNDYEWADLVDKQDEIRMLIDPKSSYAQAAAWAMGRSRDDEILAALGGSAYGGENGTEAVVHPNSQKIASVAGAAGAFLNIEALIRAKSLFGQNDVDESEELFLVCDQKQLDALLGTTQVTSSDFNSVKALVEGKIDTFMGFKFIRTQRVPTQSGSLSFDTSAGTVGSGGGDANGYRKCYAYAKSGLLLAVGIDALSKITERDDKSYATQVYHAQSCGATRMEEEKVVEILCKAS